MGFFSDPFGKAERIRGFEERYTALMEKVEEDRKSAKIVRELRYDPRRKLPGVPPNRNPQPLGFQIPSLHYLQTPINRIYA